MKCQDVTTLVQESVRIQAYNINSHNNLTIYQHQSFIYDDRIVVHLDKWMNDLWQQYVNYINFNIQQHYTTFITDSNNNNVYIININVFLTMLFKDENEFVNLMVMQPNPKNMPPSCTPSFSIDDEQVYCDQFIDHWYINLSNVAFCYFIPLIIDSPQGFSTIYISSPLGSLVYNSIAYILDLSPNDIYITYREKVVSNSDCEFILLRKYATLRVIHRLRGGSNPRTISSSPSASTTLSPALSYSSLGLK